METSEKLELVVGWALEDVEASEVALEKLEKMGVLEKKVR